MNKRWEAAVPALIIDELEKDLKLGPRIITNGQELRLLTEEQVAQVDGLKICIYANEHPPPHFHVQYGNEENSFSLEDGSPLYPNGDLRQFFRNIKRWHKKNRKILKDAWNQNRPKDCPVGDFK